MLGKASELKVWHVVELDTSIEAVINNLLEIHNWDVLDIKFSISCDPDVTDSEICREALIIYKEAE